MGQITGITVLTRETYKGSQWERVRILPDGSACVKGFVLVEVDEAERQYGNEWREMLQPKCFRPEYAKTIQTRLEFPAEDVLKLLDTIAGRAMSEEGIKVLNDHDTVPIRLLVSEVKHLRALLRKQERRDEVRKAVESQVWSPQETEEEEVHPSQEGGE